MVACLWKPFHKFLVEFRSPRYTTSRNKKSGQVGAGELLNGLVAAELQGSSAPEDPSQAFEFRSSAPSQPGPLVFESMWTLKSPQYLKRGIFANKQKLL